MISPNIYELQRFLTVQLQTDTAVYCDVISPVDVIC